jgi:hypothetical protein
MEERLMADREALNSTQQRVASSPEPQPERPGGETAWTMALKSLFWFVLVPGGVLWLAKWLLQP